MLAELFARSTIPYQRSTHQYRLKLFSIYLLLALLIALPYFTRFDWDAEPRSSLESLVEGTAYKPFIYRALIPLLVRSLASLTPFSIYFLAFLLVFFSLFGFVISARYLATAFYQPSLFIDILSGLGLLFLFPLIFSGSKQIYDFSTLFFFTLGLAYLARGEIRHYLILFPLACLNRETTLLLTLFFMVYFYRRLDLKAYLLLAGYQLAVFALIRLGLGLLYNNNPGGTFETHWSGHYQALFEQPKATFDFLILCLLVLLLTLWRWKEKPEFLRTAALVLIPLAFTLYLVFGFPYEIRVFLEIYPLIGLLSVQSLWSILYIDVPRTGIYFSYPNQR
jgi:hypothetical protein